jgi:D-serine dehydratase
MNLSEIDSETVDELTKGVPGHAESLRLSEIGSRGWSVAAEDLPLPLLTLSSTALTNNIAVMQRYCEAHRVLLAPHGKTTMAPQVFAWQLKAGAWGIAAATVQQLQVYRRFGVPRVLFANQLVGTPNLAFVCLELKRDPSFELTSFVDSVASVEILRQAAKVTRLGRPFQVLLEVGYIGGRTGVRDVEGAVAIWRAIREAEPYVQLVGVAGFEGLMPTHRHDSGRFSESPADNATGRIEDYLAFCTQIVERLQALDALPQGFLITAGGSAAFDMVVEWFTDRWASSSKLILRSGCYVTHDHGMYKAVSPLREGNASADDHFIPALELWSYVQSRPEPELALLTLGKRDTPFDYGLPVPISHIPVGSRDRLPLIDCTVTAVNDQHAYLRIPSNSDLVVGSRVVCGISHPCTAFDKWRVIPLIDDDANVIGAIRTFF